MDRPSYRVVTMVTCVLVLVGGVVTILRPYVPKDVHGRLKYSNEEYQMAGNTQEIDWYPNTQDPFLESKRTGKAILLVIGAPWSRLGRKLDGEAFLDDSVVNLLNEDFVCIRVDGMHHPDWLNALMPLKRLAIRFPTGCQLWVIDPQGQPIQLIGQPLEKDKDKNKDKLKFDRAGLHAMLDDANKAYSKIESGAGPEAVDDLQSDDIRALRESSMFSSPDYFGYSNALRGQIDAKYGGFPTDDGQTLLPGTWKYLLLTGDNESLMKSLLPILQSPIHDAVDGGFYRNSSTPDGRTVSFDKLTNQNAKMLLLLAQIGRLLNLPAMTAAAKLDWSYLADRAYQDDTFVACRVGDEAADGRSDHSSYSPRRLRAILNSDDRVWARANLGLVVSSNQLMSPFPVNLDVLIKDQPTYTRIVTALKNSDPPPEKFAGIGMLSTDGFTAARMLETARIWREPAKIQFALDAVDLVSRFEHGFSGIRPDMLDVDTTPLLPDYLAFADARLEEYLVTGRIEYFNEGLARLLHALDQFSTDVPGVYRLGAAASPSSVQDVDVPELADNTHESCTAQIIRLCYAYGKLLGDTGDGKKLLGEANQAVRRFSEISSNPFSPLAGSYFASSLLVTDDRCAIAVGSNPQALSDELFAKVPTRLVAPAFGPVRRDLQKRASGIYILGRTSITGPFTVDQAAAALSPTFPVNG